MKFDIGDVVTLKTLNDLPQWYSMWDNFSRICGKKVLITRVTKTNPAILDPNRVVLDGYKYDVIDLISAISGRACDSGMFVPGSEILSPRIGQTVNIKSHYDPGKNGGNYRFGFYDHMMKYGKLKVVDKQFYDWNTPHGVLHDDHCLYKLVTPEGKDTGYDWSSSMFRNNNPNFPYLF